MKLKLEKLKKCHFGGKTYQRGEIIKESNPGAIKFLKRVGWAEVQEADEMAPEPLPSDREQQFVRPEHPLRPTMLDPNEPDPEPWQPRKRGRPKGH